MKALTINFFSPAENSPAIAKPSKAAKPVKVALTGYISSTGKLTLPAKTVANLGINLDETLFKVGMDQGKRKAKSLYLVPSEGDEQAFGFEKAAKSYTLALPFILTRSGIDFSKNKYAFTIRLFEYEGKTAFALQLAAEAAEASALYTGKPRGRKPKSEQVAD
ncbi:hypothetical protein [Spirosoma pollinicola]|uniref:Uncharacterized protein n=1 Tax=Spirosoma pollinicola TaxID=2057025 RepID=A0A2K8YU98_9BACT|nr:hypothetical protein [Spirosoma pollinicola]AUD01128.1 hypothetical protein CWM47_04410 [Spirosoma pollinicola]